MNTPGHESRWNQPQRCPAVLSVRPRKGSAGGRAAASLCSVPFLALGTIVQAAQPGAAGSGAAPVRFVEHPDRGELEIRIDEREAVVLQHGAEVDLAHFFPVRSPSGRSMTVQRTEPYPHHRSFWFADTVQLADGRTVSFYNAYYSGPTTNKPGPPFRDRIRLVRQEVDAAAGSSARLQLEFVWETDGGRTPVLQENRDVRVRALGQGEYLLDITFTLGPAGGPVTFTSDWVHYAWPFIRMNTNFAAPGGGLLTSSEGAVGEKDTNGRAARWVDFSSTLDGVTEGLAIFSHPSNPGPHGWLTRDYGVFGPRREDARSGKPFTVRPGEIIHQRVGVLIHRGDVTTGRVAERFQAYAAGDPPSL